MPQRIDGNCLRRWCDETSSLPSAVAVAERLGWLAPWWMSDEALARAAEQQPAYHAFLQKPRLSLVPGSCWPICVVKCRSKHSLLRPAILLPCQWQRGQPHDPFLPRPLVRLADLVCSQVKEKDSEQWGLRLNVPYGGEAVDLSAFDESAFEPSSAWASLATGLILAVKNLCPDTRVWASAAWDEKIGIGAVSGINEKLELAKAWNASKVFLPAQDHAQAEAWCQNSGVALDIRYLAPVADKPNALRVLEPYLAELLVEPEPKDSLQRRLSYYEIVPNKQAIKFYGKSFLWEAIKRNSQKFLNHKLSVTHLVTALGNQANHVFMTAAALGVRHCLAVYKESGSVSSARQELNERCQSSGITLEFFEVPGESIQEEARYLKERVEKFAPPPTVTPSQLAFDLTPGFKSLTLALLEVAPKGAHLLYCRHEQLPDGRVKPGTEKYDVWQKP